MTTDEILTRINEVKYDVMKATTEEKNDALLKMADALTAHTEDILAANARDLEKAGDTISDVMKDRLRLSAERIAAMAEGVRDVAKLPDPVGKVLEKTVRPNGLEISKVRTPMGVIAIIYESRPNVTSDAASLALKAGSACVLRSGKEAHESAAAIVDAMKEGLKASALPADSVLLIEDVTRASSEALMKAHGRIDLLIPRGGKNLIRACVENANVPVLETGTGICHIYVDCSVKNTGDMNFEKALDIIENAKCSRPSVCNAEEVLLVHEEIAADFLPLLNKRLTENRVEKNLPPVELRLSKEAAEIIPGTPAGPEDFDTEFLDYVLAVKTVKNVEEAAAHINVHSTGHSEAILTNSEQAASYFTATVDSACVYVNASTRFTDGGEFGFGAEMGISTQKLHARGPLGLNELCAFRYIITGNGQTR